MDGTCQRLERSDPTPDRHGKPQYTYSPTGDVSVCGIRPPTSRKVLGATVVADYVVRLPHGFVIGRYDRLRLLSWHNEALIVDGELIGEIEHGPTAKIVKLKVVPYGN